MTTVKTAIEVPQIEVERLQLTMIGDSPLIVHAWSEKAKKEMLDKQMKKAKQAKVAKDPERDYQDAFYFTEDGKYGFPCVGFKAAAVTACRYADMKMTAARGAFHVEGEMVEIIGEPRMREDMVRIAMGTADIRYRPEFPEWKVTLTVAYNVRAISVEQIINLFNIAGFGVGVGEWRPEKDGQYGRFHVETQADN